MPDVLLNQEPSAEAIYKAGQIEKIKQYPIVVLQFARC